MRVEELESRIAELTARLEAERETWSRLRVTREPVAAVVAEMSVPDTALPSSTPSVPVPSRLTRPHSMVRVMQSEPQPLGLAKPVQGRALRLIQALITATESEGHSCSAGKTGSAPPSHRRRRASPHFTITAQGHTVGFLVLQDKDRTEHVATEKELAEAKKYSWIRIPRFDRTPAALSKTGPPRSPKRSRSAAKPPDADAWTNSRQHGRSASAGKPPWKGRASSTPRRTASGTSKSRKRHGATRPDRPDT